MAVITVELWIVLLYFFMTDGSSVIHEAFPAWKSGFFVKLRFILSNRSAKTASFEV